jgi:hypothetical protein
VRNPTKKSVHLPVSVFALPVLGADFSPGRVVLPLALLTLKFTFVHFSRNESLTCA